MNEFLLSHTAFAIWGFIFLVGGIFTTVAWAYSFKRLARTEIQPGELRWEAWRGVLGSGFWIISMLFILLLMVSTYDIHSVEAVAVCDSTSPLLLESIAAGGDLIIMPAVLTFAIILGTLFGAGLWSGALTALRPTDESDVQVNQIGKGEHNG